VRQTDEGGYSPHWSERGLAPMYGRRASLTAWSLAEAKAGMEAPPQANGTRKQVSAGWYTLRIFPCSLRTPHVRSAAYVGVDDGGARKPMGLGVAGPDAEAGNAFAQGGCAHG
jgi:hypothetical protein